MEDDAVLGLRWGQPAELKNSFRANFGVCLRRCLFAAELSASCSFGRVTAAIIVRRFTPEAIFRALWNCDCTGKRYPDTACIIQVSTERVAILTPTETRRE